MPTATKNIGRTSWKRSGIDWHPKVLDALRIESARRGVEMRVIHHRLLVRYLRVRGLLPDLSGEEIPA